MNWITGIVAHPIFCVAMGGAIGSCARYQVGLWLQNAWSQFPFSVSTTLVNCVGSLVLGCVAGALSQDKANLLFLLLGVGFCGGFTTFSTFSMELVEHLQQGRMAAALVEAMANVVFGCLLFFVGVCITRPV